MAKRARQHPDQQKTAAVGTTRRRRFSAASPSPDTSASPIDVDIQERQATLKGPLDQVVNAFDLAKTVESAVGQAILNLGLAGLPMNARQGSVIDAETPCNDPRMVGGGVQITTPRVGLWDQFHQFRAETRADLTDLREGLIKAHQRISELETELRGQGPNATR